MSSYLPTLITNPIAQGTSALRSAIGSVSLGPALSVSKAAVTSMFQRIENGTLVVKDDTTGQTTVYGQQPAKPPKSTTNGVNASNTATGQRVVELNVNKESFWVRVFLFADMGFAEAYMLAEVDCSDLTSFFQVRAIPSGE
jgi:cyclopropane-fatty-acyl-phospholipid synthase